MKPMGIVRKIDECGRLVIPMEARKTNNWPEGTPMEMLVMEDGIFIRKYSTLSEDLGELVKELKDGLEGRKVSNETLLKAIELLENKK